MIKRNLATHIQVTYDHLINAFSYIDLNIILTENGFNNYDQVLELVWARINQIKETGPQEYIYEEYSKNCRLSWEFYEKNDAYNFVSSIAERMQRFDPSNMKDILKTEYLYHGFNKEGIIEVLKGLDPENCIINLYSQSHGKMLEEEDDESESGSESESDDVEMTESGSDESDHGVVYQVEKWYGTKYTKEKIPANLMEKMKFPNVNED